MDHHSIPTLINPPPHPLLPAPSLSFSLLPSLSLSLSLSLSQSPKLLRDEFLTPSYQQLHLLSNATQETARRTTTEREKNNPSSLGMKNLHHRQQQ
jgi:hypothetical protein